MHQATAELYSPGFCRVGEVVFGVASHTVTHAGRGRDAIATTRFAPIAISDRSPDESGDPSIGNRRGELRVLKRSRIFLKAAGGGRLSFSRNEPKTKGNPAMNRRQLLAGATTLPVAACSAHARANPPHLDNLVKTAC